MYAVLLTRLVIETLRQLGDLGILRGVVPWLLGGSEDPWLSVPVFRRVWFCRCYQKLKYNTWSVNRAGPVVRKNSIGTIVLPITRCYTPY